jgi:hypothetical protein
VGGRKSTCRTNYQKIIKKVVVVVDLSIERAVLPSVLEESGRGGGTTFIYLFSAVLQPAVYK